VQGVTDAGEVRRLSCFYRRGVFGEVFDHPGVARVIQRFLVVHGSQEQAPRRDHHGRPIRQHVV